MDVHFIDIIFFAMVAAFLVLRLRSVLGRRTGNEQRRPDPFQPGPAGAGDKVIALPDRNARPRNSLEIPPAVKGTPLEAGLTQIGVADPNFTPAGFVDGAKVAFEMIIDAYAKGDRKALRPLLNDSVFENFQAAIKAREDAKESHQTTLVGIKSAEILEARVDNRTAFVTAKFVSEQINVTRDKEGRVTEGDPSHVAEITDIWTFARNTRSRDPNWTLVETRSTS